MDDELKVLIQWPNGSVLPVLTSKTSKASDLMKLLRFAYSPDEDIYLFYKGNQLNPEISLDDHLVIENEIIEAFFTPKSKNIANIINPKVQSIVLEAAKVADRRFNLLENQQHRFQLPEENEDDEDDNFYNDFYTDVNNEQITKSISSDPLPTFWKKEDDQEQFSLSEYQSKPNITSIEDAGNFYESRDWPFWM